MYGNRKIRILIVDDSAIVRRILTEALSGESDIEVVGTAPDPYVARDKILALSPDVLTLDIEMPRMDGLTFLKKLMHFHPLPAIIISSLAQPSCLAAIQALEFGAGRGTGQARRSVFGGRVATQPGAKGSRRRRCAHTPSGTRQSSRPRRKPSQPARLTGTALPRATVLAIGASTGGTEAIANVLLAPAAILSRDRDHAAHPRAIFPRLCETAQRTLRHGCEGGRGRRHAARRPRADRSRRFPYAAAPHVAAATMSVSRPDRGSVIRRPSVDVLFSSVAEAAPGRRGGRAAHRMGNDGAQGLLKMRQAGARTIAQNEATCVVYGMPREAVELGAAAQVLPLPEIAEAMLAARSRHDLSSDRGGQLGQTEVDDAVSRELQ